MISTSLEEKHVLFGMSWRSTTLPTTLTCNSDVSDWWSSLFFAIDIFTTVANVTVGKEIGFQSGRITIYSVVRLENDIRKAQVNESVIAVFLDIEKANDMVWKEGLLIKLRKLGVSARVFNWIKDFFIMEGELE